MCASLVLLVENIILRITVLYHDEELYYKLLEFTQLVVWKDSAILFEE